MIEISTTDEFERRYQELPKDIQKKAEKQEKIFRQNIFYPSLRTEKLNPKNREIWSFRIDKQYRIFFRFIAGDKVLFLTTGPHDWIYKIKF